MPESPAVSIITPVYNTAALLIEAVESVWQQPFGDFEMIIVDDGSADPGELDRIVSAYGERFRVLHQSNQGPSAARNRGLRDARGELVVFLDSDDILLPGYLTSQIRFLQEHPQTDVVYCDAEIFGDGVPVGIRFMDRCPSNGEITFASLVAQRCTVLTTVTARRRALEAVDGFDPDLRSSEDFDLWLRLLKGGFRIGYHREVLARHRVRAGSLASDQVWMYQHAIRVLDKVRTTLALSAGELALVEQRQAFFHEEMLLLQAKRALGSRDYAEARRLFGEYRSGHPTVKNRLIGAALGVAPGILRFLMGRADDWSSRRGSSQT